MKESVQPEETPTSKSVSDRSNSDSAISSVAICQEESSNVLSAALQGKTTAATNSQNTEEASYDVVPITNHSVIQKDAMLHNQDSVFSELPDDSQWSASISTTKLMHAQIMKAVKDVPAPKLSSHTEWEEGHVVSPVEELQKRLVKHASIISPEVVEDSGKISVVHESKEIYGGPGPFIDWHFSNSRGYSEIYHFWWYLWFVMNNFVHVFMMENLQCYRAIVKDSSAVDQCLLIACVWHLMA